MSTMNFQGGKIWHRLLEEGSRFVNVFGASFDREEMEFAKLVVHDEVKVSFYFNILGLPESAPARWVDRGNNAARFSVVFHKPWSLEVSGALSCFDCIPVIGFSDKGTSFSVQFSDTKIVCIGWDVSISEIRPYQDVRIKNHAR